MIDKAGGLSADALGKVTRELLATDAELLCDADLHNEIVARVQRRKNELSGLLNEEISAAEEARRRLRRPLTLAAFTLFVLSVLLLVWTISWNARTPFRSKDADVTFSAAL